MDTYREAKRLGTIETKIKGTVINIKDIGQIINFGYHVQFIENNKVIAEAVIMKGTPLFDEIQATDFYKIAELIYNAEAMWELCKPVGGN